MILRISDNKEEAKDYLDNKELLTEKACKYILEKKLNALGVIYASPDDMSHKYGFQSSKYFLEFNQEDNQIACVVGTIEDIGLLDRTVFIVTSNHVGVNTDHGGITLEGLETPFIISGKGIEQRYAIPDLMMEYDVESIVLDLFDIVQPS